MDRPRVILLFTNPHPHSVRQGMFLSPNTRGQKDLFWPVMEAARKDEFRQTVLETDVEAVVTFNTGWRYRRGYMQFSKASLDRIRRASGCIEGHA